MTKISLGYKESRSRKTLVKNNTKHQTQEKVGVVKSPSGKLNSPSGKHNLSYFGNGGERLFEKDLKQ